MIKIDRVIRSQRKTACIEIGCDLSIIVKVPNHMSCLDIEAFITKQSAVIEKNIEVMKRRVKDRNDNEYAEAFSCQEIAALIEEAYEYIPMRIKYFAEIMNVTYKKISIKNYVSRWGSCSAQGNLSFNCLLMLAPKCVVDYLLVHELCHRKEMNHSKSFWNEVEKYCPDYKECKMWLKQQGLRIIEKNRLLRYNKLRDN